MMPSLSTRPYLIRAIYEWCTDNGLTPYVAVRVDDTVQVPREFVKNGEIVLNVSFDATSALQLGNDFIEFKARFAGKPRDIMVPIANVQAIYARENGQGMAFPSHAIGADLSSDENISAPGSASPSLEAIEARSQLKPVPGLEENRNAADGDGPQPPLFPKPTLKRIK